MARARMSYKASDVAALFLLGLFLGAACYLILSLAVMLYDWLIGKPEPMLKPLLPGRRAMAALAGLLWLAAAVRSPALAGEPPGTSAEVAAGLRPPGSAGEGPVDWSAIPPWRQTSFFGVRAEGQVFIYVVDCSGSMADQGRMARAKAELRRSIARMGFPQRFLVIFYNDEPIPMPGHAPKSADGPAKDNFLAWLQHVQPEGETDPRAAMSMALNLRPDAIFLLSDGEFPGGTVEAIAGMNKRKIPINCIDMAGGEGAEQLKRIAEGAKGRYALRP